MRTRSSLESTELIERYRDADHCVLWYESVQINLWRTLPAPALMKRMVSETHALARYRESRVAVMVLVGNEARPSSDQERAAMSRELEPSALVGAALIVTGTGFLGAAMRSTLTLVHARSRAPHPMKMFDQTRPAAQWISDCLRSSAQRAPHAAQLTLVAERAHDMFLVQGMSPTRSIMGGSGVHLRP